jgi:hypothetical protein
LKAGRAQVRNVLQRFDLTFSGSTTVTGVNDKLQLKVEFQAGSADMTVNGQSVHLSAPVHLVDGHLWAPPDTAQAIDRALAGGLTPARTALARYGLQDTGSETVEAGNPDQHLSLTIRNGSAEIEPNGRTVKLSAPARLIGGQMMLPADAVGTIERARSEQAADELRYRLANPQPAAIRPLTRGALPCHATDLIGAPQQPARLWPGGPLILDATAPGHGEYPASLGFDLAVSRLEGDLLLFAVGGLDADNEEMTFLSGGADSLTFGLTALVLARRLPSSFTISTHCTAILEEPRLCFRQEVFLRGWRTGDGT